jgi:hypothetical protein
MVTFLSIVYVDNQRPATAKTSRMHNAPRYPVSFPGLDRLFQFGRPDTAGPGQNPAPGPSARVDRHNGIGDEITGLHPGPKQLQKIRSYVN